MWYVFFWYFLRSIFMINTLSLCTIKYLNELCLPYCSFLETNILLTLISSILNIFCFYCRSHFFWYFCCWNLCSFRSFLYTVKKKVKKFLIIIRVHIHWLYILLLLYAYYYLCWTNDVSIQSLITECKTITTLLCPYL